MAEGAEAPPRAAPPLGRAAPPRGGCPVDDQDRIDRDREMAKYLGALAREHDRAIIDVSSPPRKVAKTGFRHLAAPSAREIDLDDESMEESPSARRLRAEHRNHQTCRPRGSGSRCPVVCIPP